MPIFANFLPHVFFDRHTDRMLRRIAAVVAEPIALFELGVLAEVFGVDRTDDGVPPFDFRICSTTPNQPLASSAGGHFVTTDDISACDDADLIAIPAQSRGVPAQHEVLLALQRAVARGAWVMSVCSGAFVLGEAGLLDGRDCTTHWLYAADLTRSYPNARVDPNVLFVVDGPVLTSAGTAAGIDACLHLVRLELGSRVAGRIARRMVIPPQRDGGQRQFVEEPLPPPQADSLAPTLAWMVEHLDQDHSVADLARHAGMSERSFARHFSTQVGSTPHRWLTTQRVLRARELLESSGADLEEVARLSGFSSAALLRHHFRQVVGLAPGVYRRRFS